MVRRRRRESESGGSASKRSTSKAPAKRSTGRRILMVLGVLVVVAGLIAGATAAWSWWSFSRFERASLDLAVTTSDEPQNFLLIGSDSREGLTAKDPGSQVYLGSGTPDGRRSDSIAIVRFDPKESRISMLSIPRDLWLPISPTGEKQRINTAFSTSAQTLIDTIQSNFQIPINHYVEVDFAGFQDLINTIGGVPMYFDRPVRDRNSGLMIDEAGCHLLDGYQGLAFARSRHLEWNNGSEWVDDPSHDMGRMSRQQELLRAAMAKVRSLGLTSLTQLNGLIDAAVDNVTLDDRLGIRDLLGLGSQFAGVDPGAIQTYSLPVTDFTTSGGAAVELLDPVPAQPMLDVFRGTSTPGTTTTTIPPVKPSEITVSIYNGTPKQGEARRVSYVLSAGGFTLGPIENADRPPERSVVFHAPGGKEMGELVARWLGPAPEVREDPALAEGQVRVVLGPEFSTVDDPGKGGDTTTTTTAPPAAPAPGAATAEPPPIPTTTFPGGWTPTAPPAGIVCR